MTKTKDLYQQKMWNTKGLQEIRASLTTPEKLGFHIIWSIIGCIPPILKKLISVSNICEFHLIDGTLSWAMKSSICLLFLLFSEKSLMG